MWLSLLPLVVSSCAQSFLKGATLTNQRLEAERAADFSVDNCREVGSNPPVEGPAGVTYHLVTYEGAPGLFENLKGRSSVITNSWLEAVGRHFFVSVMATGRGVHRARGRQRQAAGAARRHGAR